MRRRDFFGVGLAAAAVLRTTGARAADPTEVVLVASTIGPIDAGIVPALAKAYHARTGVVVRYVGAGTGATLEMARRGEFDLVIVHALALEKKFLAEGFGVDRQDVMYNDFVILGPPADPAGIKGLTDSKEALRRIAATQSPFVSRGDNSGTHVAEKELWDKAGLQPHGNWYEIWEKGSTGNGPTLKYADSRAAYLLMDRATWLVLERQLSLKMMVEGDRDLFNYISAIRINPERFPKANAAGAQKFVDWLLSAEAQAIIADFGRDTFGQALFFPNAGGRVKPPGL